MTITDEIIDDVTDDVIDDVTGDVIDDLKLAAPCGLYCGICPDYEQGICHGCGCTCADPDERTKTNEEECLVQERHQGCAIYQCCVEAKGLRDCSACSDFPCVLFVCFTHDPLDRTRLPALMNLQRRRRLGLVRWLREERAFWQKEENRRKWRALRESLESKGQVWGERKRRGKRGDEDWSHFLSTLREISSLSDNERRRRR